MRLVVTRNIRTVILATLLLVPLASIGIGSHKLFAASGACTAPSTDYGTVTNTVSVTGAGTYRVWTRMSAPSTTANTYMLEIDGTSCYTIGGSTIPTYASGATTFFASGTTNWIAKTSAGTFVDVSLTAGNHSFKLIGAAAGVVVDRLVLTQDTSCQPTGTGDNCATPPDTTPPAVNITTPAANASLTATTTVTANATDDVAVSKVEFYVGGVLKATDTTGSSNNYTYSLDPSTFTPGTYLLTAKAYDTSSTGNPVTSASVSVTIPDKTAPVVSAVASGSLTQTGATITWTTNEASDSQVVYGTTTAYGSSTTLSTSAVTAHSVSLTGLTAGTTYHYQVKSKDAAGNLTTSPDATFVTQAIAADTTKPTVTISAPAASATISGSSVTVSATASDNVGVVGVQFKVNGTNIGAEDTTSPYSVTLDTTTLANGSYPITAVARDAAGNAQTAATVTVTVNNVAPTFLAPDINKDGHVSIVDFSLLAADYGKSGTSIKTTRCDINGDGVVNIVDFSLLAAKYGL